MKKANVAIEILVLLVTVVLTSAIVFALVQTGVLTVKAENDVSVLNTEFLPSERAGHLVVKEFKFCSFVDSQFQCINPKEKFTIGDEVYFTFDVESSTFNGEVMIVENYKLFNPFGKLLLDVEQKDNYNFETKSKDKIEIVKFKDFFLLGGDLPQGTYTVELNLENPLLNKKIKSAISFELQ
jgi:hypothetical protein